ncbi:lipopolysaccharide assembly LapA domain-containing protein [Paenalcaligenes sp. Me131]|uniref:LapA family protein n=1 Tax=Paenalcaligenes sp. Me131 TaxID=3392636 RepID=UPI003D29FCBF
MRYLVWVLRLLVFVIVLLFALKNTEPVDVHFFANYMITDVPLVVVMLTALIVGLFIGVLLMVLAILRKRREVAKLKQEIVRLERQQRQPIVAERNEVADVVTPL